MKTLCWYTNALRTVWWYVTRKLKQAKGWIITRLNVLYSSFWFIIYWTKQTPTQWIEPCYYATTLIPYVDVVLERSEIIDGSASDYFKERNNVRKLQTAHIKPNLR